MNDISVYQLNRAIYNWIRAGEVNSTEQADGRAGRYGSGSNAQAPIPGASAG